MAFHKGFTILTPRQQQPGFMAGLLHARPLLDPRDTGENQPGACCLNTSRSLRPRGSRGVASELKGRRGTAKGEVRGYSRWWKELGSRPSSMRADWTRRRTAQGWGPCVWAPLRGRTRAGEDNDRLPLGWFGEGSTGGKAAHQSFDLIATTVGGDRRQEGSAGPPLWTEGLCQMNFATPASGNGGSGTAAAESQRWLGLR